MKGKDFMHRNIQFPNEYYRNPDEYYKNFYPRDFWDQSQEQLKAEQLKGTFEEFKNTSPNAYHLLVSLFGDVAYKVFMHLDLKKLSEGKCLELLKFLTPIEDCSNESRAHQAMSTPMIEEIA